MSEKELIKNSIDKLEPRPGARERMLRNIEKKASATSLEQAKAERKAINYSKILRLAAAACLIIGLVGVGSHLKKVTDNTPGDVLFEGNPLGDNLSQEEMESRLGIYISIPDNASNTDFRIIDSNIGSVTFDFNSRAYTLRFSNQDGDFSGINGLLVSSEKIDAQTDAILETLAVDDTVFYKLSYTDGKTTFILSSEGKESYPDIVSLYNQIK